MENKKARDIVLKSRNIAIENIAYNINKMGFLPKVEDNFNFRSDNKMRLMAHILRNGFKTGYYVDEKFIEENGFTIKENQYALIFEYLKEIDAETGQKSYRFFKKYNIEQINETDKALEILSKEVKVRKKYNLRKEKLETFFKENNFDLLNRILFIGIIRIVTGKDINFGEKYEKAYKDELIKIAKENPEFIRNVFIETDRFVNKYLYENELVEE
ncbi:hypothetical protein [Streptobacillus moniliformis]|uniref:Uncharacterized protein n=1 Tax=Streptobacillus moniliformis (strain ATCC 14647 / DSM 12112 / NCTC 10651 / 9901) TaxID=519441 RepID=D1AYH8_STRM9|nr:hypothetical protein [Streptobacillus moniliformis]ACZ01354.1 hypothetical protein Smon_0887 [Streptobacillus moniliformis DSM 12112]AVL43629.1 hypothetical protein CEP89_07410 [Streptobacillus moniliformis]SQA13487.1 Uncharacterised protein [Streptobacillus moniliformis]